MSRNTERCGQTDLWGGQGKRCEAREIFVGGIKKYGEIEENVGDMERQIWR